MLLLSVLWFGCMKEVISLLAVTESAERIVFGSSVICVTSAAALIWAAERPVQGEYTH